METSWRYVDIFLKCWSYMLEKGLTCGKNLGNGNKRWRILFKQGEYNLGKNSCVKMLTIVDLVVRVFVPLSNLTQNIKVLLTWMTMNFTELNHQLGTPRHSIARISRWKHKVTIILQKALMCLNDNINNSSNANKDNSTTHHGFTWNEELVREGVEFVWRKYVCEWWLD